MAPDRRTLGRGAGKGGAHRDAGSSAEECPYGTKNGGMSRVCVMGPDDARLPNGWSVKGKFVVRRADGKTLPFVLTSYHEDRPTRRDIRCRFARALEEEYRAAREPAPKPDLVLVVGELVREGAPGYRAELLSRASRASPSERAEVYCRIGDLDRVLVAHGRRMRAFATAAPPASPPRRDHARPRARLAGSRAPARRRPATSAGRAAPRAAATGTSPPAPGDAPQAPHPDAAAVPPRSRANERPRRATARPRRPGVVRSPFIATTVAILLTLLPPREPLPRSPATKTPRPRAGHGVGRPDSRNIMKGDAQ